MGSSGASGHWNGRSNFHTQSSSLLPIPSLSESPGPDAVPQARNDVVDEQHHHQAHEHLETSGRSQSRGPIDAIDPPVWLVSRKKNQSSGALMHKIWVRGSRNRNPWNGCLDFPRGS